ncbi:MAG: VOC family protein [Roseinatronobacter sp.]
MPLQRVTLITLGVVDLPRARAFYAALGWIPAQTAEGAVFYQLQGQGLCPFGLDDPAQDQGRAGASLGTGAVTLAQNFHSPADVDAAFAQAIAAGATPLQLPEPVFWGGYRGYYADPDGHVWEVAHNPFWSLGPERHLTIPDAS